MSEGLTVSDTSQMERKESAADTTTFAELGVSKTTQIALQKMGFLRPTVVQVAAVPPALEGRDILVQSRTGSGKTAAFGIPLCDRIIDISSPTTQALVLAPTRELARQVARECERIAAERPLITAAIYGGTPIGPQIEALARGAHLVIGTPGRLLDHLRRGTFKTHGLRALVLDEGDEMLSMGFQEEINAILERLPKKRQSLIFSATIPADIERLCSRYLDNPLRLALSSDSVTVHSIDHIYHTVSGGGRMDDLLRVLKYENPRLALVFCNTKNDTNQVSRFLGEKGYAVEALSSDLSQKDRERVMARMRGGELRFLVATDVAARGIDIADVTHVINYTFPESADVYVHRTGRTGRAGKAGKAISLVSPREVSAFYQLKLIHKVTPTHMPLPLDADVSAAREGQDYEYLRSSYQGKNPTEEAAALIARIHTTIDGDRLLALVVADHLENLRTGRREDEPGAIQLAGGEIEHFSTRPLETARRGSKRYAAKTLRRPHSDEGMVTLFVGTGRKSGVSREDLTSWVQIEGRLKADDIGALRQREHHTFVDIREEHASRVVETLSCSPLRGKTLRVELSRPKEERTL